MHMYTISLSTSTGVWWLHQLPWVPWLPERSKLVLIDFLYGCIFWYWACSQQKVDLCWQWMISCGTWHNMSYTRGRIVGASTTWVVQWLQVPNWPAWTLVEWEKHEDLASLRYQQGIHRNCCGAWFRLQYSVIQYPLYLFVLIIHQWHYNLMQLYMLATGGGSQFEGVFYYKLSKKTW